MSEIAPIQPSPPPGEEQGSQAGLDRLRRHLAARLAESCDWIYDVNGVYQYETANVPEAWLNNMAYSRYKLYGYLVLGDAWGSDVSWATDHLIEYLDLEDNEEKQEAIHRFVNTFDVFKLESLYRIMKECEDIASTKVKDYSGLGDIVADMAEQGYEKFKEAAEMTILDFITSRVWEDLSDIIKEQAEETEDNEEKRELEKMLYSFDDEINNLLTVGTDIAWILDEEITRMLVMKLKIHSDDVDYMLRCLEDCM